MLSETWAKSTDRLAEAAIELLYRQWRAVGAGASGRPATAQVDPEALILASLALQHHERRLWLVMSDWLVDGARLVSTQRLKNLLSVFGAAVRPELSRLAQSTARLSKDSRWRALAASDHPALQPEPLRRRRSGGVTLEEGPALPLRLRAGFGIGVKADIIAFLLGQEYRATVSAIAESLACSTPTAFRALQDMLAAGFVKSDEVTSASEYKIASESWTGLLGRGKGHAWWRWWAEVLSYVLDVLSSSESLEKRKVTEYVLGVRAREIGERHSRALSRIRVTGVRLDMPETARPADWVGFHERVREYLLERA